MADNKTKTVNPGNALFLERFQTVRRTGRREDYVSPDDKVYVTLYLGLVPRAELRELKAEQIIEMIHAIGFEERRDMPASNERCVTIPTKDRETQDRF